MPDEHFRVRFGMLDEVISSFPNLCPALPPAPPMRRLLVSLLSLLCLCPLGRGYAAEPPTAKIDFNREIRPILSNQCSKCHGPDEKERKGGTDGLRLDIREDAARDLGGYAAIVPGKPQKSALVERIIS